MRSDRLYLEDMVNACEAIARFVASASEDDFLASELLQSAVLHKLTVVGEAAARVSAETRSASPEVPWPDIIGFRNIVVHAYFSVDWKIVWSAARNDAPELKRTIDNLLSRLPPRARA